MATGPRIAQLVDELIDLFNRRSLDLPDGLFTRHTQFLLDGVPFEETLGRSPTDPLVLMLTRGPAGARFIAKAVTHAVPDARLERGSLDEPSPSGGPRLTGQCWLSGHLRGSGEAIDALINVEIAIAKDGAESVSARLRAEDVVRLREARALP